MAALNNQLSSPFPGSHFRLRANFTSDELIDTLELSLRRVLERPAGVSLPLVRAVGRALMALARIRTARRFFIISDWICRDFHLGSDKLQSRSREQRIAFASCPSYSVARSAGRRSSRLGLTSAVIAPLRFTLTGSLSNELSGIFHFDYLIQELKAQITQATPITAA